MAHSLDHGQYEYTVFRVLEFCPDLVQNRDIGAAHPLSNLPHARGIAPEGIIKRVWSRRFWVGGREIAWIFYHISEYPTVYRRIAPEIGSDFILT